MQKKTVFNDKRLQILDFKILSLIKGGAGENGGGAIPTKVENRMGNTNIQPYAYGAEHPTIVSN